MTVEHEHQAVCNLIKAINKAITDVDGWNKDNKPTIKHYKNKPYTDITYRIRVKTST